MFGVKYFFGKCCPYYFSVWYNVKYYSTKNDQGIKWFMLRVYVNHFLFSVTISHSQVGYCERAHYEVYLYQNTFPIMWALHRPSCNCLFILLASKYLLIWQFFIRVKCWKMFFELFSMLQRKWKIVTFFETCFQLNVECFTPKQTGLYLNFLSFFVSFFSFLFVIVSQYQYYYCISLFQLTVSLVVMSTAKVA